MSVSPESPAKEISEENQASTESEAAEQLQAQTKAEGEQPEIAPESEVSDSGPESNQDSGIEEATAESESSEDAGSQETSSDATPSAEGEASPSEDEASAEAAADASDSEAEGDEAHVRDEESELAAVLAALERINEPEDKLEKALEFMQSALSATDKPNFKAFWAIKKLCIELFKDCNNPLIRSRHWQVYTHLGKEAKRLRDEQDEESQFAVDQIDAAIGALEEELRGLENEIAQAPDVTLEQPSETVAKHWDDYNRLQRKVAVYNTHAVRINSLRKELMGTGMRIRFKNQFFQRLSAAGDLIFPPRKELIRELSELFTSDVQNFVDRHFGQDQLRSPLHVLREEIKALQGVAKVLTLSTRTFNETRKRLSECWDRIRDLDKERRKHRQAKKEVFRENQVKVEESIQSVADRYSSEELTVQQAAQELDKILKEMRDVELGREEVTALKAKITEARQPLDEVLNKEAAERRAKEQERQEAIRAEVNAYQAEVEALFGSLDSLSVEDVQEKREHLQTSLKDLQCTRTEKQMLERQLKPLRDVILEKKEASLLSLSAGDKEALDKLRKLREDRRQRRKEIKEGIEQLRKAAGSSGVDFEKAMEINAQLEDEKQQLQKADAGITEIEQKIAELEAKVS